MLFEIERQNKFKCNSFIMFIYCIFFIKKKCISTIIFAFYG